jgi:hypothetical protein
MKEAFELFKQQKVNKRVIFITLLSSITRVKKCVSLIKVIYKISKTNLIFVNEVFNLIVLRAFFILK